MYLCEMDFLPFADHSGLELQNLFETGYDKLKNIINNSKLPKHINQLIPYFANSVPGSIYYVEDKFNPYIIKIRPRFSVFHLNIRSLNCHHKELIAYLHLLGRRQANLCFHFAGGEENLPDIAKPRDASMGRKQNSFLF